MTTLGLITTAVVLYAVVVVVGENRFILNGTEDFAPNISLKRALADTPNATIKSLTAASVITVINTNNMKYNTWAKI